MPNVTLYKPNGEVLLTANVKKFEHSDGALILFFEGEAAEYHGQRVTTNLPYFIGSKDQG